MLTPETEADLSDVIKAATGPLSIRGGGTRLEPVPGDVLSTQGFSGVSLYEPGALTIVAGAGTPLAEIEAVLAREGQMLPFEPPNLSGLTGRAGTPTIGGAVAANASGPRRIQAGAARDSLIGVRFVDGMGQIAKNGGRVMKNVTGYDLVKLFAGSHGTLGVLTQVAFKVLPAPPVRAVLLIEGLSPDQAVTLMTTVMASPYDVNGAAHTVAGLDGDPVTMIRLEGFEASVAHRVNQLRNRLDAYGEISVETDPERTTKGWNWVRDVEAFHELAGDVWRISVKPTDAPAVINRLEARGILMDWSGGLIWALVEPGLDVRQKLAPTLGHATLVRSEKSPFPRFHPEAAPIAAISSGLRRKFDPRGILNPGLMG